MLADYHLLFKSLLREPDSILTHSRSMLCGCLCHEEFNVSCADVLAIFLCYGSLGFSSVREIDDSLPPEGRPSLLR
jgi:hypothetical protein